MELGYDAGIGPASSHQLEIALAQLNPTVGDLVGNANGVIAAATEASASGAQIVVFSELAISGAPPEDLAIREDFLAASREQLERVAAATAQIVCIVGSPVAHGDGPANAIAVLGEGRVLAFCAKREAPDDVFGEASRFVFGEEPALVNVGGVSIGLTVGAEAWLGNGVFEEFASLGAQMVVNAAAVPFRIGEVRLREQELGRRAARAGLPVVHCNMVGGQDGFVFSGASLVIDHDGSTIARGPEMQSTLVRATVNPAPARDAAGSLAADVPLGEGSAPTSSAEDVVWPDPLESEVYLAVMTGIRDYVEKNDFPGVIVGTSGGIDSALTLSLACDALGADRVTAVMMPSPYSSEEIRADARDLIERLGCASHELAIKPLMDCFGETLSPIFSGLAPDVTEENIQARIRGVLLMALSNKFGSLVLATGNKSELAVGYATLYGDMTGGFAPLADAKKDLVVALSRWRNSALPLGSRSGISAPIPAGIISRPPTAELRRGQTDEAALGRYELLDSVIEQYVGQERSLEEIVRSGPDRDHVERILKMVDAAEHKRHQAPPGVRLTDRAFGRDRRMPITARRHYG